MRDFDALTRYLAARRRLSFAWGTNDCVLFAVGAVLALTGRDLRPLLPQWSTESEARRALARRGGLEKAVGRLLTPIAPAQALRGDVAGVAGPDGLLLCVVDGMNLVGPDASGARILPRAAMLMAWSAT